MAQRGFTLIELMIVIALIAILAAIGVPHLMAARLAANETAAIAMLRSIITAQAQFRQASKADEDSDGTGEYGGFIEMSGAAVGRMTTVLSPPVLASAFRVLNGNSEVSRSGYLFKMFLPDSDGAGVGEDPLNGFDGTTGQDPNMSETIWCCYAWPADYHRTGNRTFFGNQAGDVLTCEVESYRGTGNGPDPDAAFNAPDVISAGVDLGGPGQNPGGEIWKQVR